MQRLAVFVTQSYTALDALSRVVVTDKRLSFSVKVFSNSNEDFAPKLASVASLTQHDHLYSVLTLPNIAKELLMNILGYLLLLAMCR